MHPPWCDIARCADDPTLHEGAIMPCATLEEPITVALVQPSTGFDWLTSGTCVRVGDYYFTAAQANKFTQALERQSSAATESSSDTKTTNEVRNTIGELLPTAEVLTVFIRPVANDQAWGLSKSETLVGIDDLLLTEGQARALLTKVRFLLSLAGT